jgi:hypothetical protein
VRVRLRGLDREEADRVIMYSIVNPVTGSELSAIGDDGNKDLTV